jgi:hypothetical protein
LLIIAKEKEGIMKGALLSILLVILVGVVMVMPAGAVLAPQIGSSANLPSVYGSGNPNTGAYIEFNFGPNGAVSTAFISGALPYDRPLNQGADDILINVFNNSGTTLSSFNLTGSKNDPVGGIFGFDGDGVDTFGYNYYSGSGDSGYEGPVNTFTVGAPFFNAGLGINVFWQGTVNFTGGGLASGSNTWFALESIPDPQDIHASVPEPASLLFLGLGLLGVIGLRRKSTK